MLAGFRRGGGLAPQDIAASHDTLALWQHYVDYIRCSERFRWLPLLAMDLCTLVGTNLRRLRLAAGLTQEELAHRGSIDRTYLSDIERGIRNPTVLVIRDLAVVLEVHPAIFLVPADRAAAVQAVLLYE